MGSVAVGHRRTGATRAAAGSVDQRDHHAAACAPQFRFQASQELLSRLCRYHGFAEPLLRDYFPGMPCYEHFVALQKSVFVPLVVFLLSRLGTGLYYIDSTALPVCDTHRLNRHLPVWPSAARPQWAGSSASNCTLSSTTAMKSSA